MEYYPRIIEEKMKKWIDRREIVLVKGPRQAGKTTLLLHLNEEFDGNYITLEDEDLKKSLEANPKQFASRYMDKEFLFVDEAQYVKDVGKVLKLIYDLFGDKLKLIVTGSGSFDIKVEVGKYLVGRGIYFELFPLNFEEFLLWKAKDLHKTFLDYKSQVMNFIFEGERINEPVFEKEFHLLLQEYVVFGGFPAVVKEGEEEIKKELLKNLVRTYVEKDVFFFLGIRHIDKFRGFINYLAFNNGSMLNISSLMNLLNMDYKTVDNYVSILSNTYLVSLVPPFHKNLSTELRKSRKYYFVDTGLRNSIINNFLPLESRNDKGTLLENFIFNELSRDFEKINYWRTTGKAEVDFVINTDEKLVPVEVKSETKVNRSFRSLIKSYRPERAIVFTQRDFKVKEVEGTEVAFIPHYFI